MNDASFDAGTDGGVDSGDFRDHHPRLVTDRANVSRIKALYDSDDPFAVSVIKFLRQVAARPDPGSSVAEGYDPYKAEQQGAIAKSAAFLALLGV
ncbi:MAG: hypothetical protein WC889_20005, partial [Myxococcota bacterium]